MSTARPDYDAISRGVLRAPTAEALAKIDAVIGGRRRIAPVWEALAIAGLIPPAWSCGLPCFVANALTNLDHDDGTPMPISPPGVLPSSMSAVRALAALGPSADSMIVLWNEAIERLRPWLLGARRAGPAGPPAPPLLWGTAPSVPGLLGPIRLRRSTQSMGWTIGPLEATELHINEMFVSHGLEPFVSMERSELLRFLEQGSVVFEGFPRLRKAADPPAWGDGYLNAFVADCLWRSAAAAGAVVPPGACAMVGRRFAEIPNPYEPLLEILSQGWGWVFRRSDGKEPWSWTDGCAILVAPEP